MALGMARCGRHLKEDIHRKPGQEMVYREKGSTVVSPHVLTLQDKMVERTRLTERQTLQDQIGISPDQDGTLLLLG